MCLCIPECQTGKQQFTAPSSTSSPPVRFRTRTAAIKKMKFLCSSRLPELKMALLSMNMVFPRIWVGNMPAACDLRVGAQLLHTLMHIHTLSYSRDKISLMIQTTLSFKRRKCKMPFHFLIHIPASLDIFHHVCSSSNGHVGR